MNALQGGSVGDISLDAIAVMAQAQNENDSDEDKPKYNKIEACKYVVAGVAYDGTFLTCKADDGKYCTPTNCR